MQLMERVVERGNMKKALKRVEENKGASGVDKMSLAELREYLKTEWAGVKEELLSGRYKPESVREVEIPKPGGKETRKLGIPTVLDRLIQQAIHQILSPIFELGFSESSFGFRPGRSAHQAVRKAQEYVASGKRWVVDMDLEKFFDRVNHDVLMSRLGRKVKVVVLVDQGSASPLSSSRNDERWNHASKTRRDSARRSSIAATVQYSTR